MPLTTAGARVEASAIVGASFTPFDPAHAYIGVGDGTTPFSASQTDLQGTNKFRAPMDTELGMVFPRVSGNVALFQSSFAADQANFAWNEWGIFDSATGGTMLVRKQEYVGTKTSGPLDYELVIMLTWTL